MRQCSGDHGDGNYTDHCDCYYYYYTDCCYCINEEKEERERAENTECLRKGSEEL
jgi:hypothetical protein